MSPWNWVAIASGVILLCFVVGVFISILEKPNPNQASKDAEALLRKANEELKNRPHARAMSHPLPSLHRTHYEP